ncbi:PHP domain-containing protein [Cellulomonas sp. ATA003]|uniref:PHP domain-containing protein n=1 Tax=Cellulomonas sp. ATA003 TaxID=3073064 RepID=UPI0037BFE30D
MTGQPRYAELHAHSAFSFLDGANQPEELAAEAARLGLSALALTDHDGLYGVVRFAQAARDVGLPTVFGAELHLPAPGRTGDVLDPPTGVPDPRSTHLLVLARGADGYRNLSRAIATAHLATGHKGAAAYTLEGLAEQADGQWLVLTGCRKGAVRRALEGHGLRAGHGAPGGHAEGRRRRPGGGPRGAGPAGRPVRPGQRRRRGHRRRRPVGLRAGRRPRRAGGVGAVATGRDRGGALRDPARRGPRRCARGGARALVPGGDGRLAAGHGRCPPAVGAGDARPARASPGGRGHRRGAGRRVRVRPVPGRPEPAAVPGAAGAHRGELAA